MGGRMPVCMQLEGARYDWHYFVHVGNFSTTGKTQVKTMDDCFYSFSAGPDYGCIVWGKEALPKTYRGGQATFDLSLCNNPQRFIVSHRHNSRADEKAFALTQKCYKTSHFIQFSYNSFSFPSTSNNNVFHLWFVWWFCLFVCLKNNHIYLYM